MYNNPYYNNYYQTATTPQYSNYGNTQSSMQNTQAQYSTIPLTFVNGIEGAKAYIVPPNSTIYLRDSDSDMLFIKSSDPMGRSYLKTYKLEEIDENMTSRTFKQEDYVKMSDFKALQEDFNTLKATITQMNESKGVE